MRTYQATVSNVKVSRGDRIYFRLQSGCDATSNGSFDEVSWAPLIFYQGESHDDLPNGYGSGIYRSEEGAVYSHEGAIKVEAKEVVFSGTFVKPVTSDVVRLRILASQNKPDEHGHNPQGGIRLSLSSSALLLPRRSLMAYLQAPIS